MKRRWLEREPAIRFVPEYRQDVISGKWTLLAPERAGRPIEFSSSATGRRERSCPFCRGHEEQTPEAILQLPEQPGQPWQVRVVPNLFPAVARSAAESSPSLPWFPAATGYGAHEVIIESPLHVGSQHQIDAAQFALVLEAVRRRIGALAHDRRIRYVQFFRNQGHEAGASLEHLHSQLIGLAQVPDGVSVELQRASALFTERGKCVFCELMEAEEQSAERLVLADEHAVALCPFASRFPFEVWMLPRVHLADFSHTSPESLVSLARVLHRVLVALERVTGGAALNFWLHTSPFDTNRQDQYHWHMEIVPRMAKTAGFEWGTGWFINWMLPETAAGQLRRAVAELGE